MQRDRHVAGAEVHTATSATAVVTAATGQGQVGAASAGGHRHVRVGGRAHRIGSAARCQRPDDDDDDDRNTHARCHRKRGAGRGHAALRPPRRSPFVARGTVVLTIAKSARRVGGAQLSST